MVKPGNPELDSTLIPLHVTVGFTWLCWPIHKTGMVIQLRGRLGRYSQGPGSAGVGAGHQPGGERQVSSGRWWLHATVFLMSAWLQFLILGSMFTCQSHTLFSMTPVNFWHGRTQDLFLQLARWLTHSGCSANTGWANVSQGEEGQCAYSQVGRDHACRQVSSFFISASGVSECMLHSIGGSAAMP